MMAVAFGLIGAIPSVTATAAPFIILYGVSYTEAEAHPGGEVCAVFAKATCPVVIVKLSCDTGGDTEVRVVD